MADRANPAGSFIVLPSEVFEHILLTFLDLWALCQGAQVNSHWRQILDMDDELRWAEELKIGLKEKSDEKVRGLV